MNFKVALLTEAAMNLASWEHIEWFGLEEMYIPYPFLGEYALAYEVSDKWGNFEIEVSESFPFLSAYKNGEFLCTIELPFICFEGQIIYVRDFGLRIKAPKSARLH